VTGLASVAHVETAASAVQAWAKPGAITAHPFMDSVFILAFLLLLVA